MNTLEHIAGDLTRMLARLQKQTDALTQSAEILRDHADKLHGPECEASADCVVDEPCYGEGLIGTLDRALDLLGQAQSAVAKQASRNCRLV